MICIEWQVNCTMCSVHLVNYREPVEGTTDSTVLKAGPHPYYKIYCNDCALICEVERKLDESKEQVG